MTSVEAYGDDLFSTSEFTKIGVEGYLACTTDQTGKAWGYKVITTPR